MIGFKKINRLNHDDCDDIYIINKERRRKYDFFEFDDEERDQIFDAETHEPKTREYETRYKMQKITDMSVGRLNKALKKDHLLMRFTSED